MHLVSMLLPFQGPWIFNWIPFLNIEHPKLVKRHSGEFDRWWEKSERDLIHEKK
jgi:hypothetical protein